jgi:hypothetical protein
VGTASKLTLNTFTPPYNDGSRYSGRSARLDGSDATFEEIAYLRSSSFPNQNVAGSSTKQENG